MMTGMMRRQNSYSPMDDKISLSSRSFFKTMFRGLSDPDGRVSHYDLVSELIINSQKFGRGGGR
jgi:hypothetical protein